MATINLNGIKIKRATRTQLNSAKTHSTLIPYTFVFITDESKLVFVKAVNDYIDIGATSGGTSNVIAIDVPDQLDNLYYETTFEDGNWLLIEDSEDGYAKKKVKFQTLRDYGAPQEVTGVGYIAGGFVAAVTNSISGLDLGTEQAVSISTTLTQARRLLSAVNSSTNGFFGGGYISSAVRTIDGIVFATNSALGLTRQLSVTRDGLASVNSRVRGYFAGGYTNIISIDYLNFDTITVATNSYNLITGRCNFDGVSSETKGYFCGGMTSGPTLSTITTLVFSTGSTNNLGTNLSKNRAYVTGFNSENHGYISNGYNTTYPYLDDVDRITFSNDTVTHAYSQIIRKIMNAAGVNSNAKGYICGGRHEVSGVGETIIIGYVFENSTNGIISSTLGWTQQQAAGCQSGGML